MSERVICEEVRSRADRCSRSASTNVARLTCVAFDHADDFCGPVVWRNDATNIDVASVLGMVAALLISCLAGNECTTMRDSVPFLARCTTFERTAFSTIATDLFRHA